MIMLYYIIKINSMADLFIIYTYINSLYYTPSISYNFICQFTLIKLEKRILIFKPFANLNELTKWVMTAYNTVRN